MRGFRRYGMPGLRQHLRLVRNLGRYGLAPRQTPAVPRERTSRPDSHAAEGLATFPTPRQSGKNLGGRICRCCHRWWNGDGPVAAGVIPCPHCGHLAACEED